MSRHKIVFTLWKDSVQSADKFRDSLIDFLPPRLLDLQWVDQLRLCVVDSAVEGAAHRRMENCQPLPDAVLSVYLKGGSDSGSELATQQALQLNQLMTSRAAKTSAYRVEEYEPLPNLSHPGASGARVYGYCQVVFLQRPPHLSEAHWLELWLEGHTQLAIDTQSTFGYRQNVIKKACQQGGPRLHAMIEENFPPAAMGSDQAFYGVSTDTDLKKNMTAMIESCARFIDFDKIDVIPMSEYGFAR